MRFDVGRGPAAAEYDLGRAYRKLYAQVGLADTSTTGGSAQMDVLLDGKRIATHQVALGQVVPLDLDVTKGLRLRLEVSGLTDSTTRPSFGDIRVEP